MRKLGTCDCESKLCDEYCEHEPAGCPSEATVLIEVYGIAQHLCEDCLQNVPSAGKPRIIRDITRHAN